MGRERTAKGLEGEIEVGVKMVRNRERMGHAAVECVCGECQCGFAQRMSLLECGLASGDTESTVSNLIRLSNLLPPSTTLLTTIFRLAYFLLLLTPAQMSALHLNRLRAVPHPARAAQVLRPGFNPTPKRSRATKTGMALPRTWEELLKQHEDAPRES